MKAAFIILSCLAITAMAQWNQPNRRPATCSGCRNPQQAAADNVPDWCPLCPDDPAAQLPPRPDVCGVNCSPATMHFLWAHVDPNMYWQCVGSHAVERLCACPTLFDYGLQRCVHRHEWSRQCDQQTLNPTIRECVGCPNCPPGGGDGNPIEPPPPNTTTGTVAPPPDNCICICIPCTAWPCAPCPSSCCQS